MSDPLSVTRNGHRTWFKWHRGRRKASDPVFTGARILEGMRLGASIEVDLVIHGERGFAVLHDLELGREFEGKGAVVDASATTLRDLHLRGNDGQPIADRVMLLEDLCGLLAGQRVHADALLQLDYKEDAKALDAAAIRNFAASVGPVAKNMILSAGDAEAVKLLTDATPGIRIGYDPCHDGAMEALWASRDFAGFVRDALAASPKAEMIYLAWQLPIYAQDHGFDIIGAFHAGGRRVDTWTIQKVNAESLIMVERLLALRVDQITTDDPEGLAAALE